MWNSSLPPPRSGSAGYRAVARSGSICAGLTFELMTLFDTICGKEGVAADEEALALISRAADGSARDGLSILGQAMALADGKITASQVQDMLGH